MRRRVEYPKNEAAIQRKLEGAQEHLAHIWGALRRAGLDTNVQMFTPANTNGRKPGAADYHLAALEFYLIEALWGSYRLWGRPDGQLCPYQDCCWDLAFRANTDWYRCPICHRLFCIRETDGDYEDYHCRRYRRSDPYPTNIAIATPIRPSWDTPEWRKLSEATE